MKKNTLIIVESPAKSSTITKFLGTEYTVGSSMGHVLDLPKNVLGIDLQNNFQPHYVIVEDKRKVIDELKRLAREAERILLASDPDREGEAIAFHLREILKEENENIFRIMFHEITKPAILEAVANPREIDLCKVESQQLRRLLDRIAGYKISPVLQKKIGGPLSAGRVQSIALKLIVEREREIRAFVPEEYWTVEAELEGSQPPPCSAKLEKLRSKNLKIENGQQCEAILQELNKHPYLLQGIRRKAKKKSPPPPLITSSLQQEAFRRFKFSIKRTMQLAQELYEGVHIGGEQTGLITYMRTDSLRIADQAREQARHFIASGFGEKFVPSKPRFYSRKTKVKAQDAHECIRPTFPFHTPDEVSADLNPQQLKLYRLIWDRFLASQMADAEIEETVFSVLNGEYLFLAKGEVVRFHGFLELLRPESEETLLPPLAEGEELQLRRITPKQNFTKPPARYSEASLVKVLEEKGIGRPSTYAKIIETLGKREYVIKEEQKFVPSNLGFTVVDFLEEHFRDIMDYNFTAKLEEELDQVSEGKQSWLHGIAEFYEKLAKDLEKVKGEERVTVATGQACPRCGAALIKRYSHKTRGWFIGCAGYPECTYTEKDHNGEEKKSDEMLDKKCPQCGSQLVRRYSKKTRSYFVGCSAYPRCTHIEDEESELGDCPECGKKLKKRFSRKTRRYFLGCSGYPDCQYIQRSK